MSNFSEYQQVDASLVDFEAYGIPFQYVELQEGVVGRLRLLEVPNRWNFGKGVAMGKTRREVNAYNDKIAVAEDENDRRVEDFKTRARAEVDKREEERRKREERNDESDTEDEGSDDVEEEVVKGKGKGKGRAKVRKTKGKKNELDLVNIPGPRFKEPCQQCAKSPHKRACVFPIRRTGRKGDYWYSMPRSDEEGNKKVVCVACRIRHLKCDCEVDDAYESGYDFKKLSVDFDGQMRVKKRVMSPVTTRSQVGVSGTSGAEIGASGAGLEVLKEINDSLKELVVLQRSILQRLPTSGVTESESDRSYEDSSEADVDSDTDLENREVENLRADLAQPLPLFLPSSVGSEREESMESLVGRKRKRDEEEDEEDELDIDATLK